MAKMATDDVGRTLSNFLWSGLTTDHALDVRRSALATQQLHNASPFDVAEGKPGVDVFTAGAASTRLRHELFM